MEWISFGTGVLAAAFAYALGAGQEDDDEEEIEEGEELAINDFSGRYVTLSCQTCRKLKRHKEISPDLYQCVKCKRHVDLRAS